MNKIVVWVVGGVTLLGVGVFFLGTLKFDQVRSPIKNSAPLSTFDKLVGQSAADFSLTSYDGSTYSLSALKGKKVVLFFNEGIMCYPGCWNQIAAFGTDPRFNSDRVIALSITVDEKSAWSQAVAKMPALAQAKVLFDTDRAVSNTYSVMWLPSSMHKGAFPGHTYILVDSKGVIRYTFDDPRMAVRNQEILAELNKLN